MKKATIILVALIFIMSIVFYANKGKGDPSQADNIEIAQIGVKTSSSGSVQIGYSPQQVTNTFGTPTSITTEYWEMDDKTALVYTYSDGKFKFLDDKLESYELSGPEYLIGSSSNGNFFSVNSSLSNVSTYLPGWSSKKVDGTLTANITNNGQQTDTYLYIEFNPSSEVITSISTRTY